MGDDTEVYGRGGVKPGCVWVVLMTFVLLGIMSISDELSSINDSLQTLVDLLRKG